jgi:hypothetical protein
MKIGRNDPCPCGSGRKYKQCCLAAPAAPALEPANLAWKRVRRALDEFDVTAKIVRLIGEAYGPDVVEEAWLDFAFDDDPFDPESVHGSVFWPWMFHCWKPDPEATTVADTSLHGVSPTQAFLAGRGRSLDPLVRQYLEACLASRFGFYEIVRCKPGIGFEARDMFTGERHEVLERGASQFFQDGDAIYAQFANLEGITLMEACAPYPIPPIRQLPLLELRQEIESDMEAGTIVTADDYAEDLRAAYFDLTEAIAKPAMPQLQNTDGEALVLQELIFDIDSPQATFDALAHLDINNTVEELLATAERDADGALRKIQLTWSVPGNRVHEEWNNTVLGSITIDGPRMTANVNSNERAAAFRTIVEQTLGAHARYRTAEVQSADKLIAEAQAARAADKSPPAADDALLEMPEVQAQIAKMMAQHYERWVEQPIPALGGRTPLVAAQDPAARHKVEALVRQAERDSGRMRPPVDPAVFQRLRQRLGLSPDGQPHPA